MFLVMPARSAALTARRHVDLRRVTSAACRTAADPALEPPDPPDRSRDRACPRGPPLMSGPSPSDDWLSCLSRVPPRRRLAWTRPRTTGLRLGGAGCCRPRVVYPLLSTALFLAVWWAVTAAEIWKPVFVPPPSAVWHQAVLTTRVHDGIRGYGGYLLQEHLWASLRRLVIGSTVGVFLGVSRSASRWARSRGSVTRSVRR